MAEITIRHELDCDEDTFWKCVFDDEYNRRLYLERLQFPGYKILEQKDEATSILRKVHIDPPVAGLPGPVKKLVGDRLSYVEEGTFDKAKKRYTFTVRPSTLAEKTSTKGDLWTEKLGDKRVARLAKVTVEVKVFAVGGLVEDKIIGDLRASYEAAARFTNEYVKEKGW
ncbi:MAG: DUF2505 family protein [Polyangiaceae bacterium]